MTLLMRGRPPGGIVTVEVCLTSIGAQPLAGRIRRHRRALLSLLAGLVVVAVVAVPVDRAFFAGKSQPARPALQRVLDDLVQSRDAPGVTAYVVGPRGTWRGSAGVADLKTGAPMPADARMRIESNSKTWLTALILQLAQERKLSADDTVEKWLPGLLRAHGGEITIRELLHDSSGLIDDNDLWDATPAQLRTYLARVGDPKLRTQVVATAARLRADPFAYVPALLFIRLAAWQPLVALPGTTYHHSNIGWNVAGLIAAKAGGKPLPVLYRERFFRPLGLGNTAFSPQGAIAGEHAHGYGEDRNGHVLDTTTMHAGKFSDGAIVTDAEDEAAFLRAAMNGTLFDKQGWLDLYGPAGGTTGCSTLSYSGSGAGDGYRSEVRYDESGKRIAVLLLNRGSGDAGAAALRLFCAA